MTIVCGFVETARRFGIVLRYGIDVTWGYFDDHFVNTPKSTPR